MQVRTDLDGTSYLNLRSNNSLLLTLPPAKSYTTLGDRASMYAAPKLWNALPEQIRNSTSVGIFKTQVKTYLFNIAFKL